MSSESTRNPLNAFTQDFLRRLDQQGEPDGAHEADVAGPWVVRPVPYRGGTGFALMREWESAETGDAPYAIFRRREAALLAAAVLPATGRERLCRLGSEPDLEGFPVEAAAAHAPDPSLPEAAATPAPAGHLREFDEDLAAALHVVEAVVRSPVALARLIEAAGYVALEQAGRILHRRIH
jgi:hypothetical protein